MGGGQECRRPLVVHLPPSSSKECSTQRATVFLHLYSSVRRWRLLLAGSELVLQTADRRDQSLRVRCGDSAACAAVTFTPLCSRGESFATRSLTISLMALASLLLMSSPLLSCCRQKWKSDDAAHVNRDQARNIVLFVREGNEREEEEAAASNEPERSRVEYLEIYFKRKGDTKWLYCRLQQYMNLLPK